MAPGLEDWIRQRFPEIGFDKGKFIGKKEFKSRLVSENPGKKEDIHRIVNKISREHHQGSPLSRTEESSSNLTPRPKQEASHKGPETRGGSDPLESNFDSERGSSQGPNSSKDSEVDLRRDSKKDPSVEELQNSLLNFSSDNDGSSSMAKHALKNAVLFSDTTLEDHPHDLPQYGLLSSFETSSSNAPARSKLFLNTNVPFSAFVCGVQGSGKSHTSACMLENCLIRTPILGSLQRPLTALVFNRAEYTNRLNFRPSEAAFLATVGEQCPGHELHVKKINVLVSPSNYPHLRDAYKEIHGVEVRPFKLYPENLNISTMLALMSFDQSQGSPLYMATVNKILRGMSSEDSGPFDYLEFRKKLREAELEKRQETFLNQRLDVLESFLDLKGKSNISSKAEFKPGEATILDLSCPFVDAASACVLFNIGLGMFLESNAATGKVLFLDEAHKACGPPLLKHRRLLLI
ncbi:hypothetical protein G7Y89_g2662 [Cudoniella acicularis]|uniref:Uncharacterized protein n=1 Tax=Cudoniella acicularis TaxID=354080 RepID=A0A8H4RU48_9HELO|nr:hypothetical protein G7Y89_g2662 [Cudoniella acicularis]